MIRMIASLSLALSTLFGQQKPLANGESLESFVLQIIEARPWRASPKQLLQRLGKATRVDFASDGSVDCYVYQNRFQNSRAEIRVYVSNRGRRMDFIDIGSIAMSISTAKKSFGSGLKEVRYAFDDCLSDDESAPIFESSKGSVVYLEDRTKGLYLGLSGGMIEDIRLQGTPVGYASSKCRK